jgi:hypothetical protein
METLRVDKSDLITVTDYSRQRRITRQTVYNWIAEKKIKSEIIAGVTFVKISSTKGV